VYGSLRFPDENHFMIMGNPPSPWSNSNEKSIPEWMAGSYIKKLEGKTFDWVAQSNLRTQQAQYYHVRPLLKDLKVSDEVRLASPYVFTPPVIKKKAWTANIKGRTAEQAKDVFVEHSGMFPKKDPKTRGDFRKQLGRDEDASEKKARLKLKKQQKRAEYLRKVDKRSYTLARLKNKKQKTKTTTFDAIAKKRVPTTINKLGATVVKQTIPKITPIQKIPKVEPGIAQYLREQHNVHALKKVSKHNYPWIAFSKGKPTLYGNTALHEKLNLGAEYRVVKSQGGVIHKAFDAAKVQPKFFQMHSVSVETY
jgi:hypothetical protein